jgi:hypothetical protein
MKKLILFLGIILTLASSVIAQEQPRPQVALADGKVFQLSSIYSAEALALLQKRSPYATAILTMASDPLTCLAGDTWVNTTSQQLKFCPATNTIVVVGSGGAGTGDVVGPSSSTDSELPLFSGIGGKTLKRSNTLTGYVKLTAGAVSAAAIPASDLPDAAADGATKGVGSFTAADFNASSGVISLDYTNGQAASGSTKGFLIAADWTTFNNKQSAISFGTGAQTALGVNVGSAGAFVVSGGALGSPSSAGTIPAFTLGGTVTGGGNSLSNVKLGSLTTDGPIYTSGSNGSLNSEAQLATSRGGTGVSDLTFSGNTHKAATTTGTFTTNNCVKTDANGNFVDAGGTCGGSGSGANPSASLGLSAINGSASTFMRSDAAPALNQAIAPTWTGPHIFSLSNAAAVAIGPNGNTNPAFRVVTNVASAATGLSITGNAAGSGVDLTALSSGTDEDINLNPKGSGGVKVNGTGTSSFGIGDTDNSNYLLFEVGSDLTADRILTFTTGDAARTVTLSGNLNIAANFTTSGANALTLTTTGATNVTLPTTGTLAAIDASNSWADGVKQTFNPNGTNAGINVGAHTANPSSPANGDVYYNSTADELRARIGGAWVALGSGGGGGGATTALDNLASVAINTTLLSDTDDTDSLGTTIKRWKNGFFSGYIDDGTGNGGIKFGSGTPDVGIDSPAAGSLRVTNGEASSPTLGWMMADAGTCFLAADQTVSSTTFANLTGCSISVISGAKYVGKIHLFVSDSVAAEGVKVDFDGGSATATNFRAENLGFDSALTIVSQTTALATDVTAATFTGNGYIEATITFEPSANGTFIPRVAQNSHSTGTLTVARGSYVQLKLVAVP